MMNRNITVGIRTEVMLDSLIEATFFFKVDCLQHEVYNTYNNAAFNLGQIT